MSGKIGNQRDRKRATHGVFHHFIVLACAEQNADGGLFVVFAYIAIQRLQVKTEFALVMRSFA